MTRKTHNGRVPAFRLVTVPHSGTVFTRGVLAGLGFEEPRDYRSHHTDDLGFPQPYSASAPVVVAVRDPLMAEISRLNRGSGLPIQEWAHIARLYRQPDVWLFRVDCPEKHRWMEYRGLAGFLGVEVDGGPDGVPDWSPVNTCPDRLGLKARYLAGEVPDELRPAWEWLRGASEVQQMFGELGYVGLPWMEGE